MCPPIPAAVETVCLSCPDWPAVLQVPCNITTRFLRCFFKMFIVSARQAPDLTLSKAASPRMLQ